jgi:hypothetical protein
MGSPKAAGSKWWITLVYPGTSISQLLVNVNIVDDNNYTVYMNAKKEFLFDVESY